MTANRLAKTARKNVSMLFETCRPDRQNKSTYYFRNPLKSVIAYDHASAEKALAEIEGLKQNKYWIAGYFSYELGYIFERGSFRAKHKYKYPLLELYVFKKPKIFKAGKEFVFSKKKDFQVKNIRFNIPFKRYKTSIARIKRYIENGDVYQINYTGKLKFKFKGEPSALYRSLTKKQEVQYSAFLKLGNKTVLSLSPELFFSVKNGIIESKPMKGTLERGKYPTEDSVKIKELKESSKNRAENIMITDLIRNDLGRICRTGSVVTSKIYEVIKYNTLLQMITTVKGRLSKSITWKKIFENIFPGGSITGAPKIRAMQIIRELEKENRNIYCGALGFISPKNDAVFSIPIRTILLKNNTGEMGIGSGIVYDSEAKEEYEEALLKAKFLTEKAADFKLIETILWDKKYILLDGHTKRLEDSAEYFNFEADLGVIRMMLVKKEKEFEPENKYRVRLLLSADGNIEISTRKITPGKGTGATAVISNRPTNSNNKYLYHKTTMRELYEKERKRIEGTDIYDVIFQNERGEITEGAITNVFIKKKNILYTPPISSGLLPGVYREYLLKEGGALERVLKLEDLKQADNIYLVNSVRGIVEICLIEM